MAKPRTVLVKIDPEVRAVLERSNLGDCRVILPPEQLPRDLYQRVDAVLRAAGGKWVRSAKCHLFPGDPREILGLALEAGGVVDAKRSHEQFYTPDDLADELVACVPTGDFENWRVLEPSAGRGALVYALRRRFGAGPFVTAVDVDPENTRALIDLMKQGVVGEVFTRDFLTVTSEELFRQDPLPERWREGQYDLVLMNPPFRPAAQHVLHAFAFLRPGGVLVSIVPPTFGFGKGGHDRNAGVTNADCGDLDRKIDPGAFNASGTGVGARIIRWRKPL